MTDIRTTPAVAIRRGLPADAPALAAFGARTFAETFAADNRPSDMALYLERTYGEARQRAELTDPAMTTLLAESEGRLVAFAQLRAGPTPESVTGRAPIELLRFYVDRPWQGRGLARVLMGAVEQESAHRGADRVWLSVWEQNERAKAFYRRCGFVDVGPRAFLLGTDQQTDRVMVRVLATSEPEVSR